MEASPPLPVEQELNSKFMTKMEDLLYVEDDEEDLNETWLSGTWISEKTPQMELILRSLPIGTELPLSVGQTTLFIWDSFFRFIILVTSITEAAKLGPSQKACGKRLQAKLRWPENSWEKQHILRKKIIKKEHDKDAVNPEAPGPESGDRIRNGKNFYFKLTPSFEDFKEFRKNLRSPDQAPSNGNLLCTSGPLYT
uniref:SFRICE_020229 n=1 Tax=Spodoptera frugiperda TaxID=7108 RepID=A0A2H1V6F3_SPOFR